MTALDDILSRRAGVVPTALFGGACAMAAALVFERTRRHAFLIGVAGGAVGAAVASSNEKRTLATTLTGAGTPWTPVSFAHALLSRLGVPTSANNVRALVAAQAIEGGFMFNTARFNPLNTTMPMPGSHAISPGGVQAYTNWQQGVDATAKTLVNNPGYNGILQALDVSADPSDTLIAWANSPWGLQLDESHSNYWSYASKVFPA
jgi:hypothetical protein